MASFDVHKRENEVLSVEVTKFESFTTLCVSLGKDTATFYLGADDLELIREALASAEFRDTVL